MQLMVECVNCAYEPIILDSFYKDYKSFPTKAREKIKDRCFNMLCNYPYRFDMLSGKIKIRGLKLDGLRHMKVGVRGVKGGAFILYRICEECKQNEYASKSGVKCEFCNGKWKHIVLFATHIRSFGY